METRRLVVAIAFVGIILMAGRPLIDPDTWWHLRAGQWIVENQKLPNIDPFSYTETGQPWHYPGWLAEIIMFGIYSVGGLWGLNLFFILLLIATFLVIYRTLTGDPYLRAFIILLAAVSSAIYWSARPQLFTFFFSAIFFLCLRDFLVGKRNHLWILPILMILWVNMHGGFAVGFIFLLLSIIGQGFVFLSQIPNPNQESLKKFIWLTGIGLVCLLAAIANPYGMEMIFYPFRTVSIQILQNYIQEWQSPNFHFLNAQPFLWLLFLALTIMAVSPKRPDIRDLIFLLAIGYMGFLAWRNTILLSVVAPVVVTVYGQPLLERFFPAWDPFRKTAGHRQRVLNAVVCVFVCGLSIPYFISSSNNQAIQERIQKQSPVAAVHYLSENPGLGRLFNSYNWGSYLLWNLPSYAVFVDGRTDVYSDRVFNQYLTFTRAQSGWQDILEEWNIQAVLLEPNSPILQILLLENWQIGYQDSQAVVLIKPSS